jgi:Mn2+/Fe2+ NRAMP family transporter
MDGLLLVLSALLLSRVVGSVAASTLRAVSMAYLALMFCYGIGNIANDFWIEQVVKRGWTTWEIPNVLEPRATVAWAIIVVAATAIWTAVMLRDRDEAVRPVSGLDAAARRE